MLSDDATVSHYLREKSPTLLLERDGNAAARDVAIGSQQQHGKRPLVVCEDALLLNPRSSGYPKGTFQKLKKIENVAKCFTIHYTRL